MLTAGNGHHPFKVTPSGWGSIPPRDSTPYRVGLLVRSSGFQPDQTGSIPVRDARLLGYDMDVALGFEPGGGRFDSDYPCQIYWGLAQLEE